VSAEPQAEVQACRLLAAVSLAADTGMGLPLESGSRCAWWSDRRFAGAKSGSIPRWSVPARADPAAGLAGGASRRRGLTGHLRAVD